MGKRNRDTSDVVVEVKVRTRDKRIKIENKKSEKERNEEMKISSCQQSSMRRWNGVLPARKPTAGEHTMPTAGAIFPFWRTKLERIISSAVAPVRQAPCQMRTSNTSLILLFVINLEMCHFLPFSNCTWQMANVHIWHGGRRQCQHNSSKRRKIIMIEEKVFPLTPPPPFIHPATSSSTAPTTSMAEDSSEDRITAQTETSQ